MSIVALDKSLISMGTWFVLSMWDLAVVQVGRMNTKGNQPSCLGENIAEEGWQEQEALEGLMAHELGHLIHFGWREQVNHQDEDSSWWQLYTEGFAQYCEHIILGRTSWHMQSAPENQWQEWCQNNLNWLASEFLHRIDEGVDIRPFFGSWFDLRGQKQTGYFLGHKLIEILQEQMSLREVALLIDIESHLRPLLVQIAG